MAEVFVSSEIGTLRKVIVHAPDEGISRISPKRADELLFDDIVYLPEMRQEHQVFTDVLSALMGQDNVLEAETLIYEALESSHDGRVEILELIADFEELPQVFRQDLESLDNKQLAEVLITGYIPEIDTILFDPIPNFIFTRDIAVVVNDHVIITKAAKDARHRENLLTRFIFWRHPLFADLKANKRLINLNTVDEFPPSRRGEKVSVEGGDMMILNEDYFLVGVSERSTEHAFYSLKQALFERNVIDHVVMVKVPSDRSYMHIDTIFTQINYNHAVAFQPIVIDGLSSYVEVHAKNGSQRKYSSIREFVLAEVNPSMQFILSGGGQSPYQEREQWTDACNLLAVKPGVAIAYGRNKRTAQALEGVGYAILPAHRFLEHCAEDPEFAGRLEDTIITLKSSELSRARGGSHCMSCPILRSS
ncbi:MAG: arginine deiminase family protein [Saprospiraceae bacterium]|nr:arginine deiminase family protein [Saprospiraceae bacterium]